MIRWIRLSVVGRCRARFAGKRANMNVSHAQIVFCAVSRAVHAQLTPLCPSLPPYVPLSTQRNVNGLGGGREGERDAGGRGMPDADTTFSTRSQLLPPSFTFSPGKVSRYKNYTLLGERSLNLVTRVGRFLGRKVEGREEKLRRASCLSKRKHVLKTPRRCNVPCSR